MLDAKAIATKSLIHAGMFGLVILLVLFLINAAQVLLVVFAGILLAVLLDGIASWITTKTGLRESVSLAASILVPAAVLTLGIWLIAPAVAEQASELADRLPRATDELKQRLLQYDWASRLWENKERLQEMMPGSKASAGLVAGFFSSTLGALGNLVFAAFLGLFLAISPRLYVNGAIRLFPRDKRTRAREVFNATGSALQSWLIAKLTEMAVIGILTSLGLWLLGIDLALVLGLIAAILSFIPNFGPIISVLPAVLIGLVSGLDKALYVLLLYAGIQTLESYVLTPILQQKMVDLPPALLLTTQVLLGVLAGVLGVILATPLAAAGMVMVRMWYVEDMLGDKADSAKHEP